MSDDLGARPPLSAVGGRLCEVIDLYRELRKPLLRYLASSMIERRSQDVVQDAFVELGQRHSAAGWSQENIRSWAFGVAHNQARNRQNSYHLRSGNI